ncbi:MAG TPA: winged helix-turn-helix domain-containing protein [Polyangiaceae bacterium]|jgi:DNA-binding response OmpR family regulator|nr:winged helix-turn-helix domain-containing protein [Polyangiaceae bacterium]
MLTDRPFRVDVIRSVERALRVVEGEDYEAILVAWRQAAFTGRALDACRRIRASTRDAEILAIGADSLCTDPALALEAGADIYIPSGCGARVLAAHLQALVRRLGAHARRRASPPNTDAVRPLSFKSIEINMPTMTVLVQGVGCVDLPRQQFLLLAHFIQHLGQTFSEQDLRKHVLHSLADPGGSGIRTRIFDLRRRLGPAGRLIESIKGRGYGMGLTGGTVRVNSAAV